MTDHEAEQRHLASLAASSPLYELEFPLELLEKLPPLNCVGDYDSAVIQSVADPRMLERVPWAVKYVAGLDISFGKNKENQACAAICIFRLDDKTPIEMVFHAEELVILTEDYQPGYLAFREVPSYLALLHAVKVAHPEWYPDLILCDGNGLLHPRQCGIATHLGVLTNIPTIGCAKTFMNIEGLNVNSQTFRHDIRQNPAATWGSYYPLVLQGAACDNQQDNAHSHPMPLLGAILWNSAGSIRNPLIVSCGCFTTFSDALRAVLLTSYHHVPEPIRQADLLSRAWLRERGML